MKRAGNSARAMEMPGLWKEWKAKSRLPPLPTSPLEISPETGEIPTFPQLRRRCPLKTKTQQRAGYRPPARGGALRRLRSNCR